MFPASAKGGGLNVTAGPLDTCKTPSPGGPVPIPYANMVDGLAESGDRAGRKTQKMIIDDAAHKGIVVKSATAGAIASQGDEPGVQMGILSSSRKMPTARMTESRSGRQLTGMTLTPSAAKVAILGDDDSD